GGPRAAGPAGGGGFGEGGEGQDPADERNRHDRDDRDAGTIRQAAQTHRVDRTLSLGVYRRVVACRLTDLRQVLRLLPRLARLRSRTAHGPYGNWDVIRASRAGALERFTVPPEALCPNRYGRCEAIQASRAGPLS